MSAPSRRRSSRGRRNPAPRANDRQDLWQAMPALPEPDPITPAADPTAMVVSLGTVPLPGHTVNADLYIATVIERAATLATALAASADLLTPSDDD